MNHSNTKIRGEQHQPRNESLQGGLVLVISRGPWGPPRNGAPKKVGFTGVISPLQELWALLNS